MTATVLPLSIKQGATFSRGFTWHEPGPLDANGQRTPGDPRNLTGWKGRLQIRKKQGAPVQLEATTENGQIVLGGTSGRVDMVFPAEATGALTSLKAVYDLELVDPQGNVFALLEGPVDVDPNITQDDGEPVLK